MTAEERKLKFGLMVEDKWITYWGSQIFPQLTYEKHKDIYNKVDFFVRNRLGQTKRGQLKTVVPMRKSRTFSISMKQWNKYINDGVDLLYHICPIQYENEAGKEDIDIELRCANIRDLNTKISYTKLGDRIDIDLSQMKKFPLPESFQRWIDDLYDEWVRPTEGQYRTKKKFQ